MNKANGNFAGKGYSAVKIELTANPPKPSPIGGKAYFGPVEIDPKNGRVVAVRNIRVSD